jgi:hypothetical protein
VSIQQGIVLGIQDRYIQDYELISAAIDVDPALALDPLRLEGMLSAQSYVTRGWVSANPPSDALRYYYAALAFSCMQMMTFGLVSINLWKANASPLGARRALGGQSWSRALLPTLLAAWCLGFACVLVGFCYIRFGFKVSFGGKEPACLVVLAVSTLVTTLLGALVGSMPLSGGAKSGLTTAISCLLSMFAGLYGQASQSLGDYVARELPALSSLNTARQVSDAFLSLYYYEGYGRLTVILARMAVIAALFLLGCLLVMRRQRYSSL